MTTLSKKGEVNEEEMLVGDAARRDYGGDKNGRRGGCKEYYIVLVGWPLAPILLSLTSS